jgi:hypothetical protein
MGQKGDDVQMKNLVTALLLFFTPVATLLAQRPVTPDLSGTWKLNLEKSKLPKGSKIQSETLIIDCPGPAIQMHYTTDGKAWSQTYTADGKERKVGESPGGEIFAKARWKASILVVESYARLKLPEQSQLNGSEIFRYTDRWILSGDGRTLKVEADATKQVSVYDKLPN